MLQEDCIKREHTSVDGFSIVDLFKSGKEFVIVSNTIDSGKDELKVLNKNFDSDISIKKINTLVFDNYKMHRCKVIQGLEKKDMPMILSLLFLQSFFIYVKNGTWDVYNFFDLNKSLGSGIDFQFKLTEFSKIRNCSDYVL